MPRALSKRKLRSLYARETGEVHLLILEINHPTFAEPLRFVQNKEAVVHEGVTYNPASFDVPGASERPGELPEVSLVASAVDRLVLDQALTLTTPATVIYGTILLGEDGMTSGPYRFTWRETRYDASTLQAVLGTSDLLNSPDAEHEFTPGPYPGLYK